MRAAHAVRSAWCDSTFASEKSEAIFARFILFFSDDSDPRIQRHETPGLLNQAVRASRQGATDLAARVLERLTTAERPCESRNLEEAALPWRAIVVEIAWTTGPSRYVVGLAGLDLLAGYHHDTKLWPSSIDIAQRAMLMPSQLDSRAKRI